MNYTKKNKLSFAPTFHHQRDDGSWQLRRDIALVGPGGNSQMGLVLAMSEAVKIKDDGGEIYDEPEGEGASLAQASLDMWKKR